MDYNLHNSINDSNLTAAQSTVCIISALQYSLGGNLLPHRALLVLARYSILFLAKKEGVVIVSRS